MHWFLFALLGTVLGLSIGYLVILFEVRSEVNLYRDGAIKAELHRKEVSSIRSVNGQSNVDLIHDLHKKDVKWFTENYYEKATLLESLTFGFFEPEERILNFVEEDLDQSDF